MIPNNYKTSLLVPSELPAFIRDDPNYVNFVTFLEAYYEWMEQSGNLIDRSKNLLNYMDIDTTTDQFLQYFVNDFLPYFPEDALIDKAQAIKIAKQLYQSKGSPASYKFLFRILYNSDFDVFYTRDAVFKASAGLWYVTKSLRLSSLDPNWLRLNDVAKGGYRVFGESSKSIATVENSIVSGTKTEVFISDIQRLFTSGEFIRVVDNNNQDVLFDGQPLRAKIVGQISQLNVDPNNRGLFYQPGDPVIVYGGLTSNTGLGAIAEVGTTTRGSIQRINVVDGGYGYRTFPNTLISITNAIGATAVVGSIDPNPLKAANVAFIPTDSLSLAQFTPIGNAQYSFFQTSPTSNANTTLAQAFTFTSFVSYPISSVFVTNGGGGITQLPTVTANSLFATTASGTAQLSSLGILAPIQIIEGGTGYQINDTITLVGGSGVGAYANVTNVAANGQITSVSYVYSANNTVQSYPLGGLGYKPTSLPIAIINSSNIAAANAVLSVPGILGDGATFSVITDRAGSISTINILNGGEDYEATPNVSIKVQDIVVSNVSIATLPQRGDIVYQGTSLNVATYQASVNSVSLLSPDANPLNSLYNLRVYNYTTQPSTNLPLKVLDKDIEITLANTAFNANYNSSGVRNYGDGTAKGFASFLNGLAIGQGTYLNSQGQPSGFDVLQSVDYNNYTYRITVQKEIAKYREILLNLLHPTGMKILGRYSLEANSAFTRDKSSALNQGQTLFFYTNDAASSVTMTTTFDNPANNIITFNNIGTGVNLSSFIFSNSSIFLAPDNGPNVYSAIVSVDDANSQVTLTQNTFLTFANVALVTGNSGSNVINIVSLTGKYDIVNNGNYSNTQYPLKDIIFAGDQILVANNTAKTVDFVDYEEGTITLTSNLSANANSLMAVKRTFSAGGTINKALQVIIYGPVGLQYFPELLTEDGRNLITEDDRTILLG